LIEKTMSNLKGETHIVIMSNGGFSGIHQKLIDAIMVSSGGTDV